MIDSHAALRRGVRLLTVGLLTLALVACGGGNGGDDTGGDNTGGGTVAVQNGTVEVTADDLKFDASTIQAPAGEAFTIVLNNMDTMPHNISVYTEQGGEEIAKGEIVTGPDATDEVEVPALEPGTYFFVCDLHTNMSGSLVVEG